MNHQSILIVDDDPVMRKLLRVNLETRGDKVLIAKSGAEAMRAIEEDSVNLVILDIMMPDVDGFEVCRQIRKRSEIPIIMLTALSEIKNKVNCLDMGADDYITKPFAITELIARIRAILRRSKTANTTPILSSFTSGDLNIDFDKRMVTIAGNEVWLTPTEYRLLQELVLNADKVLTSTQLLNKVWGSEYTREKEYLRVYIGRLRAKLKIEPTGQGYMLLYRCRLPV